MSIFLPPRVASPDARSYHLCQQWRDGVSHLLLLEAD